MNKRGFTIIELLGVITVIAVLAAILFPVFARARNTARRQSCLSNLFNMGMALGMYALDNDGYYPPRDDDIGALYPQYLGDKSVFLCPDGFSGRVPMGAPADETLPIEFESYSYTYGYRRMVSPPRAPGQDAKPEEEPIPWSYYYRAGHRYNELPVVPLVTDHELSHTEKANVLFSDGGLRWLGEQDWRALGFRPLEEIIAERNPPPKDGPVPGGMRPGMMGPGPLPPAGYPPGMPPGAGPGMPPPGLPGPPPSRGSPR